MEKPKIRIHDVQTGEIIDREMNEEELRQKIKDEAIHQDFVNAQDQAKAKREALLARLGITEEEASLLAQSL